MRMRRLIAPAVLPGIVLLVVVTGLLSALWGVPSHGPDEPDRPRTQVGLASFYGPGFHGKRTASGARFDQRKMTAAHRTLPLGTRVRVTNLDNGESVELLINDRGPYGRNYRRGTIIDVSKSAAAKLDFISVGLTRVRLEVLDEPEGRAEPDVE